MQITHLGHATVLVEVADARILIDPGNYSDAWHGLTDLDAVLVTHQHPDHIDPAHVPALLAANPGVQLFVEPSVREVVPLPEAEPILADTTVSLRGVGITAVGGWHAVIHRDIPASATWVSCSLPKGSRPSSILATRSTRFRPGSTSSRS